MERKIESGPIYDEAKKGDWGVVPVHEYINAEGPHELAEKIAICRLKNCQTWAPVYFLSNSEAFIEFSFDIK